MHHAERRPYRPRFAESAHSRPCCEMQHGAPLSGSLVNIYESHAVLAGLSIRRGSDRSFSFSRWAWYAA